MNRGKCLLTNFKINDFLLDQKDNLAVVTFVSEPRKAGKHGSAKVFYNYTLLHNNDKVQAVGKSRDELTKVTVMKSSGQKVFENEEEINFITPSGEVLVYSKKFFIKLNPKDKEETSSEFYYFLYNNYCFYQNK